MGGRGLAVDQNGCVSVKLLWRLPYKQQERAPRTRRQADGDGRAVRSREDCRGVAMAAELRCTCAADIAACTRWPTLLGGPEATGASDVRRYGTAWGS
ncbi:hypothetical protein NDU88_004696 [Pleurodeles waltl]|uniref:Uncharacterized protein n=1 Tax=Pleurodeles waltl TaxID=8319 RepID=A0AAV7LMH2_PLEWA|nr:hypothetical protein NDU88_004696 [Pleurodeles waltl]